MTDGQIALLALAVFTCYEAIRWLPARAWIFQRSSADRWPGSAPLETMRSRGSGLLLLDPLPPHRPHIATASWPCAPHEVGLAIWNDETGHCRHIPWEELRPKEEGAVLHFTSSQRTRCLNATHAKAWAQRITHWKALPHSTRAEEFAQLAAQQFDLKAIKSYAQRITKETSSLRRVANLIFVWTFLALPFVYWLRGDHLYSYLAFGVLFLMMLFQATLLWRIARQHSALKPDAFSHVLGAALFPPSSMRAADWVCLLLTPECHPLAAQRALDPTAEATFLQQASLAWRNARWPKGIEVTPLPWNGPEVEALAAFFKHQSIDLATLESPPSSLQADERYCPRCTTVYQSKVSSCHDCGGLPLMSR